MASQLRLKDIKYRYPGQYLYDGVVFYTQCFPANLIDEAKKAKFDRSDVLVATYPKSGTTWMQEITWLLLSNFDYNTALSTKVDDRSYFLERAHHGLGTHDVCKRLEMPRLIKTHLYYKDLEKSISDGNPRVIVVMRNPKDVLVSYYHFYCINKNLGCYKGTWDEFFELFKNNELLHGVWKDHVTGWWTNKGKPNFHFVKYEDMKLNPSKVIKEVANFLRVSICEYDLEKLVQHTSFDVMKGNMMVNKGISPNYDLSIGKFIRKGKVGDWKNYFSNEQNDYLNVILEEMSKDGLNFEFE